eukprot:sb/3463968/
MGHTLKWVVGHKLEKSKGQACRENKCYHAKGGGRPILAFNINSGTHTDNINGTRLCVVYHRCCVGTRRNGERDTTRVASQSTTPGTPRTIVHNTTLSSKLYLSKHNHLRSLTLAISDQNNLNNSIAHKDKNETALCELCKVKENAEHKLIHCPDLEELRYRTGYTDIGNGNPRHQKFNEIVTKCNLFEYDTNFLLAEPDITNSILKPVHAPHPESMIYNVPRDKGAYRKVNTVERAHDHRADRGSLYPPTTKRSLEVYSIIGEPPLHLYPAIHLPLQLLATVVTRDQSQGQGRLSAITGQLSGTECWEVLNTHTHTGSEMAKLVTNALSNGEITEMHYHLPLILQSSIMAVIELVSPFKGAPLFRIVVKLSQLLMECFLNSTRFKTLADSLAYATGPFTKGLEGIPRWGGMHNQSYLQFQIRYRNCFGIVKWRVRDRERGRERERKRETEWMRKREREREIKRDSNLRTLHTLNRMAIIKFELGSIGKIKFFTFQRNQDQVFILSGEI